MSFAQSIHRLRLGAGLTQSALALRCGIAQPNLAAFESGVRAPSLASLEKIAAGLGLPPSAWLQDAPPPRRLDRFALDRLCRSLVTNDQAGARSDKLLWRNLAALFHRRLSAMQPGVPRRRPRISAGAAQIRLKALLGADTLAEVSRRLDKFYPGGEP